MTETIDPRRIAYLPLAELTADPRNPKAHDDEVIEKSIGRFGMLDPIVRDERTGFIVSGHGRSKSLTAMEKRGETAPEGVRTDPETGAWLVPVVVGWGSRTDAEAGAALIALNRTTELGGWVDDALLDLLDDLADMDEGLDGVGFSDLEVADLRSYLESAEKAYTLPEEDEDDSEGDEAGGSIPSLVLHGDQLVVNVVVNSEDRERLYAALHELDFIVDARDSRGR